MNIVFCVNGIIVSGGVERVLCQRANYLAKKYNYDITIITTEHNNKEFKNKTPFFSLNSKIKVIDLGIKYYDFFEENKKYNFLRKKYKLNLLKKEHLIKLNRVINDLKPDVIISLGCIDRFIDYKIEYQCKKILEHHLSKKVFIAESYNIKNFLQKLKIIYKNYLEKNMINKYDKFLVLTEEDKKDWNDERIKVIPNPLPFYPEEFSKCENKKIISVGRLDSQKGYDILIDVWNIVSKKYPDWILEIYGEGPERENLQNKINKLGLEKSFLLKGAVKDIQDKYLESSIYVMSSRYEGFGMVLVEAMACGLPVVSFDCPCGPKDIIRDEEDGFLVSFGNIKQMTEKIEELILNEEKRKFFGINARKNVQRFSQDKIMNQWKELFEELVRNK